MNLIPRPLFVDIRSGKLTLLNAERIICVQDNSLQDEEYILEIGKDGISIRSNGISGEFYARKTLAQIIYDVKLSGKEDIDCVFIKDRPRYKYRGLMVDVIRHFVTLEKLRQTIDMMAYYKLNVLHLHLTDDQGWRVEIKKYPLLTEKGSIRKATQLDQWGRMEDKPYGAGLYYTQEQLKELVEYALEKNVMIMPE
jgi:hexosaminidase